MSSQRPAFDLEKEVRYAREYTMLLTKFREAAEHVLPIWADIPESCFVDLKRWPQVTGKAKRSRRISSLVRAEILAADPICRWCLMNRSTTIDHVVPISRGGTSNVVNLVGACSECNTLKGNFMPSEIGWRLHLPLRFFDLEAFMALGR